MASNAPPGSPVPPSFIAYVVLTVVAVVTVSIRPPNFLVRTAIFLGVVASLYRANQLISGDDILGRYSIGCAVGGVGLPAWWFLFVVPSERVQFLADGVPLTELPPVKRFQRLLYLWVSPRQVGWYPQTPNLPPSPGPSRLAFILRSARQTIIAYLIMDVSYALMRMNPAVFIYSGDDKVDMGGRGFVLRCFHVMISVCYGGAMLIAQYSALGTVLIALHLGEPQYWPNMIGNVTDAYTIRRFWNRFWHQLLRRSVAPAGKSIARLLGCVKGTAASSRVQLLGAFLVSGLVHVPGDMAVGYEYIGYSLPFFMVQAIGIMVEDELVAFGKRIFPQLVGSRLARSVGYAWTLSWFAWTWPLLCDWHVRAGSGTSVGVSFSVVDKVLALAGISI